jgi:DNA adenine methylase
MPATYTPLRYPGGKSKLAYYLTEVLRANKLFDGGYAEPYAGGAGAGLHLLFRGYASRLHLNDLDRGVASFWKAVTGHADRFAAQVRSVPLSVREWERQRECVLTAPMGFDLGFAFFYLNRTNRSGIMNGGLIGGRAQDGPWRMDARFNRDALAERVLGVGRMRRRISITHLDAIEFLDALEREAPRPTFVYLDPPYFHKGQQLYPNFYCEEDHHAIASRVGTLSLPWIMTYDDCPEIRTLYRRRRIVAGELSYSAREVRRGKEVLVLGPRVKSPKLTKAFELSRGFTLTA